VELACQRWRHHGHHRLASKPAPTDVWNASNSPCLCNPCRSWLASDGGITATIASPANRLLRMCGTPQIHLACATPVGAGLPAMAASGHHRLASKPAPTDVWNASNSPCLCKTCRSWLASDGGITATIASPASRLLQVPIGDFAKAFDKEVDHRPDFHRQAAAAGPEHGDLLRLKAVGDLVVPQHRHQRAVAHRLADQP